MNKKPYLWKELAPLEKNGIQNQIALYWFCNIGELIYFSWVLAFFIFKVRKQYVFQRAAMRMKGDNLG